MCENGWRQSQRNEDESHKSVDSNRRALCTKWYMRMNGVRNMASHTYICIYKRTYLWTIFMYIYLWHQLAIWITPISYRSQSGAYWRIFTSIMLSPTSFHIGFPVVLKIYFAPGIIGTFIFFSYYFLLTILFEINCKKIMYRHSIKLFYWVV